MMLSFVVCISSVSSVGGLNVISNRSGEQNPTKLLIICPVIECCSPISTNAGIVYTRWDACTDSSYQDDIDELPDRYQNCSSVQVDTW